MLYTVANVVSSSTWVSRLISKINKESIEEVMKKAEYICTSNDIEATYDIVQGDNVCMEDVHAGPTPLDDDDEYGSELW